ncbi:MAG: metallophosphoesterase family protein, partial [Candidatus Aenigmatarchaeota archaeon]
MVNPERSHQQQRKEQQKPPEYRKDSPELIAQEWESLKLEEVRDILIKEQLDWAFKWAEEKLKKDPNYSSLSEEEKKKRKEEKIKELVRELQSISDKNTLIQKLEELGLDTKEIINLFGLVYIPKNYTVIAVTDIHGDIYALEEAIKEFETIKGQGKNVAFVCMGDFVDRGEYNFAVVKRLFELKKKYQDEVIILKGDHEVDISRIKSDFLWKLWEAGKILDPDGSKNINLAKDLYGETFSKLPHAVMYRDILLTHAGIPVKVNFIENENRCVIDEESIAIGRLIQPESGDFREINWADIDPEIEGVIKNTDRYHPRHRPPLKQIDIHKYSPKELNRILNRLGFSYFIRGHQYSYRSIPLFKDSDLAYHFQERIITFHSNHSLYAESEGEYTEGCYLILKNGGIMAKGVKEEKEIPIVQPKEEVSTREPYEGQPQQAGLTSQETMEERRPTSSIEETPPEGSRDQKTISSQRPEQQQGPEIQLQPESLEDKIRKHLEGLLQDYKDYIELLGYDLSGFSNRFIEKLLSQNLQELQQEVEIRTRFYMDQHPEAVKETIETAFVNEVFSEYRDSIEATLRRYLGVLFLNSEALFNNEQDREKVIEFLRKKCSIDDIRMFL